ncbi:MAG: peptidase MA family metallohydrolase [Chloroflexota bacterium]
MNRSFRWLLPLVLLMCFPLFAGSSALAQTNFTSTAVVAYGRSITFQLEGAVAEPVTRVDLFLQVEGAERPSSIQVIRVSQTGSQLAATVDVDPLVAALPPFATVRFWWELQTAGQIITVPEATFFYEDDRFVWRELTAGDVVVHWTGNDAALGQAAADIVAQSRATLDGILPPTAVSPLNVYIYPSTGDLRSGLRLAGRDWQDGHTDPDLGVLLVTAVNPLTAAAELSQSIPHELTHLRLHRLAAGSALPFWYEEGLARLAEGSPRGEGVLATAVANDTTLPLLNLCVAFPEDADGVELALAQSVSLLAYIRGQFGDQALRQLATAYLDGASCETGLTETLDMSLAQLNVDWLGDVAPQPAWQTFLTENGLWLLLVLASFGFMALLIFRN